MSESTEPTETSKELKEHLNEPSPELEAEAKEKVSLLFLSCF